MEVNLDAVELGVVVRVEILRQVLKGLTTDHREWWIACELDSAFERRYLTLGFGCQGCTDRLNTILYQLPILNAERPIGGLDHLVVLLGSSVVAPEQPGLYRDGNGVVKDEIADIEDFLIPIRRALVPILAEYSGLDGSRWAGAGAWSERI